MSWYRVGTVAVTNGSAVVTGTGTAFVANVQQGHAINLPDGRAYEVLQVNSDTQITLGSAYMGSTASGQTYSVQPNQGFAQQAATALATFISQYGGYLATTLSGKFGDGTVGSPGVTFAADQDTGIYRLASNSLGITAGGAACATFTGGNAVFPGLVCAQGVTNPQRSFDGNHYIARNFGSIGQYEMVYQASGGSWYNVGQRFDGSNWYFLISAAQSTQAAAFTTTFSSARPLTINLDGTLTLCTDGSTVTTGGPLQPLNDNGSSLGKAAFRFSVVYAASGTINTSDAREKQDIAPIDDELLDAWAAVEWVQFRFIASVVEKGDAARWHWGVVAQQVRDALTAGGVEGERYGVLCFDEWAAIPGKAAIEAQADLHDEEGQIIQHGHPASSAVAAVPAGDRWGIRYDLALSIEAAFQRRRAARIEARLTALEAKLAA